MSVAGQTAVDIQLELYVLDPSLIVGDEPGPFSIGDRIWLRLLDTRRYGRNSGPHVLSLGLELGPDPSPRIVAEALWDFLRPRRGGRGIVTARMVRRREERRIEATGTSVVDRHELWFAIPLRSSRGARRQIDAFFDEVLGPEGS